MKLSRLFLCLLSISFVACGSDNTPDPGPGPQPPVTANERTVLVFMAADNNLQYFSSEDLKEMQEGSKALNTNQNLIVYVDNNKSNSPSYFMRVKDGQFIDSISVSESSTANPVVLEEALRYAREKYPAKSYGLVLWGHSTGWLMRNDTIPYLKTRAYGQDSNNNTTTWMNIPSMARAIKNGMNGEKLAFILGDCCVFGSVETAYELRNVTDYVISSPAEIPDEGADYSNLSGLFDTSSTFYEKMIDLYWDKYIHEFQVNTYRYYLTEYGDLAGYSVPMMAVKTSELENLAIATAKLLNTIPDKLEPTGTLDYSHVIFYAVSNGLMYNYDMYKTLKENTAETDFNEWKTIFEKAVPYYRLSPRWFVSRSTLSTFKNYMLSFDEISSDCRVLSMFFPGTQYKNIYPSWNTTIQQLQWNGHISWQQYGW